jgi:hypothetical protein
MTLNCTVCKNIIEDRQHLTCTKCKNIHHLCCTNVSEKRFYLMDNDRKSEWICFNCHSHDQYSSHLHSTPATTPNENITYRKKYKVTVPIHNSFESLHTDDDDTDDLHSTYGSPELFNRSCPEQRLNQENLEDMGKILKELREKLQSADNEIEKLLTENSQLKKQLKSREIEINKLKDICKSTIKIRSSRKVSKKGNKNRLNFSQETESDGASNMNNSCAVEDRSTQVPKTFPVGKHIPPAKIVNDKLEKNKLCVISNGSRYKLLNIAISNFQNSEICHYSSPGGGLVHLFEGLETKLQNYTLKDYCLIFISDKDFITSCNYARKVSFIKNKLQMIHHTNVIICLPTFKYGPYINFFNQRIEAFNRLLYLDNAENEYAFILDSNKNLNYSSKMFNRYGFANRLALSTIFSDISILIHDINISYTENPPNLNETFFRS